MKVLLFIRDLDVGGAQRQFVELARGLNRRGHDVAALVLYRGGGMEPRLASSGIRLLDLDKIGRWDIASLMRLRALFRTESPDVIYSFLPMQNILSATLAPRGGPRVVFGVRVSDMISSEPDPLTRLSYRVERWVSRRADAIVANSYAGRALLIEAGVPADRVRVISNGTDTGAMKPDRAAGLAFREGLGIPADAFAIGSVARLDPMKDHRTLLEAAAHHHAASPDVHWVCVGGGPADYRREMQQLGESLGLAGRVHWLGERGDLQAAYSACNISTLSSAYGEGFSNAICEAMACESPVAATDVGDSALIVGFTGEIVPPRQPEALSAAWMRLRSRLAAAPQLGAQARKLIVDNFSLERMIDASEAMLQQVTAPP